MAEVASPPHQVAVEERLLPAVRKADADTLVAANGFSCRTQIEQAGIGRSALHPAEVMALARYGAPGGLAPRAHRSAFGCGGLQFSPRRGQPLPASR